MTSPKISEKHMDPNRLPCPQCGCEWGLVLAWTTRWIVLCEAYPCNFADAVPVDKKTRKQALAWMRGHYKR